jgi:hypothetical protein
MLGGFPVRAAAALSTPFEVPLPFYDAAPDGWGKGILKTAFPNQLFGMAEFLAAAGDDRTGALGLLPAMPSVRAIPHDHIVRTLRADMPMPSMLGPAKSATALPGRSASWFTGIR